MIPQTYLKKMIWVVIMMLFMMPQICFEMILVLVEAYISLNLGVFKEARSA